MNDEFKDFKKVIEMERSPYANYLVYQVNNRNQYKNWCKAFCTPVLYKKIKKEGVNLDHSSQKTDFSKIDKYVIAYGKSISSFEETSLSYIDYESYGRDIRLTEGGIHTVNGYITMTDSITAYLDDTTDISELYE